jgi:hypothetical protein
VPGNREVLPTLRRQFLGLAASFGLADLDASAIRDSNPRALTQAISAWIYALSTPDGLPITGIEYRSRHGDELSLWAVYERDPVRNTPREIEAVTSDPVTPEDPDLSEAMRLHHLRWSD